MFKKKLTALIVAAVTMITSLHMVSFGFKNEAAAAEFEMTAQEIVDDITVGWNLGNSLDACTSDGIFSELCWGNPYTSKELIDEIARAGFNAIRVPVTWYNHMDSDNNIDEAWMNRVEEVVNYVLDNNMYCIINVHHDCGLEREGFDKWLNSGTANYSEQEKKFIKVWEQICARFKNYGDKLLFEGYNEISTDYNDTIPRKESDFEVANQLNQVFVNTVRNSGGNNAKRFLVVTTFFSHYVPEIAGKCVIPKDTVKDKIIEEVHIYEPYTFINNKEDTWTEARIKQDTAYYVNEISKYKTVPLIIGEFASNTGMYDTSLRVMHGKTIIEAAKKLGVKCFWWDAGCGNGSELINRRTCKWTQPEIVTAMLQAADVKVPELSVDEPETFTGNFVWEANKWQMQNFSGGIAKFDIFDANTMDVNTIELGDYTYSSQAIYGTFKLENGKNYRLDFTVSCDSGTGKIGATIQHSESPWTAFLDEDITVTTTPKKYSFETGPMSESDDIASLCFTFSHKINNYHLTDISLVCLDDINIKTAQEIMDDITVGWNLGNALDSYSSGKYRSPLLSETSFGSPITTKEMLQAVHKAGFNAVRIPVTWQNKLDENDVVDEAWMNRVQEVVDYAYDEGMYILLNVHHDTAFDVNGVNTGWLKASKLSYDKYNKRFVSLWTQIAERFADYDYHLMFEGYNEIFDESYINGFWSGTNSRTADALKYANMWNQLFVDTVRKTSGYNPERVLVCNTYTASTDPTSIGGFVRPTDSVKDRLITSVHCYEPWAFTGDHTSVDDVMYSKERLNIAFSDISKLEGPVISGECGAIGRGNDPTRIQYIKDFFTLAEKNNVKCFWWDDYEPNYGFGLLSRVEGAWYNPELVKTIMNTIGVKAHSIPQAQISDDPNNPNLAANTSRYYKWTENDGAAYLDPYNEKDNSIVCQVLDGGTAPDDVSFYYKGFRYEAGKKYFVSFDASCDGISSIDASVISEDTQTWETNYDGGKIRITEKEQHYTFNFVIDESCLGGFFLNIGSKNHESYSVKWRNLKIIEAVEGDVNTDGKLSVADMVMLQNYLIGMPDVTLSNWKAADFTNDNRLDSLDLSLMRTKLTESKPVAANLITGMTGWTITNNGTDILTADKDSKSGKITVNVKKLDGTNTIQLRYRGLKLEKDKEYVLSYTVSSTSDGNYKELLQQSGGDYKSYHNVTVKTNETSQNRLIVAVPDEECEDAKIAFNFKAVGTYTFSDIKLIQVS